MRKIIHVDMDCFYAAIEMRDNPALKDIPIAVGGNASSVALFVLQIILHAVLVYVARCLQPMPLSFALT